MYFLHFLYERLTKIYKKYFYRLFKTNKQFLEKQVDKHKFATSHTQLIPSPNERELNFLAQQSPLPCSGRAEVGGIARHCESVAQNNPLKSVIASEAKQSG